MVERSGKPLARLWWATLPFAGWRMVDGSEPGALDPPWYARPIAWVWDILNWYGVEPFKPIDLPVCTCDDCLDR
jgi:hypothetical protein